MPDTFLASRPPCYQLVKVRRFPRRLFEALDRDFADSTWWRRRRGGCHLTELVHSCRTHPPFAKSDPDCPACIWTSPDTNSHRQPSPRGRQHRSQDASSLTHDCSIVCMRVTKMQSSYARRPWRGLTGALSVARLAETVALGAVRRRQVTRQAGKHPKDCHDE